MNDLRFAVRQLLKAPGFAAVVVLSLSLGIGATTTVLCWIQNILSRPLPGVSRQEEIVVLVSNQGGGSASLLDLRDFSGLQDVFRGAIASQITPASLTIDRQPRWIFGQIATANFFDLLGVKPILGRTFLPDEDQRPGGDAVVVLSEGCWRRHFQADPGVIGRVVQLNRHAFTIVGVVPAEFPGTMTGLACDFWTPVSMIYEVTARRDNSLTSRSARGFHNLARLQPGVSVAHAQAAVKTFDSHLASSYPDTNRDVHHRVLPYAECPYGAQSILGPVLRLLLAVSLGVLLIVAVNVANLLLARASSRQKEIAIRLATGATRLRLIRQLLTESLLLAFLGGIGGVLLASWAVAVIGLFLPPLQMPASLNYRLDAATLGWTVLLTVSTAIGFGLIPALQASNPRLEQTLREGGRSSLGGAAHHRLRSGLVVAEIALSLLLLIGAGLCIKGSAKARQVDVGFDPNHVLTAGLQIGMHGYTEETGRVFYRRLQERIAALPGVEAAAFASWFPLGLAGCKGHGVDVPGYLRAPGENPTYEYSIISSGYFDVMKIPLVDGREFSEADEAAAPAVAIVNEHFARRFWPDQDALGKTFRAAGRDRTIVGIAKAGKYNSLQEGPWPVFYLPYTQYVPDLDLSLCLRTTADPMAMINAVREAVRATDPGVELWGTMPLTSHCEGAFFAQRIASSLLTFLGLVALLLAVMGVYAVMAYAVSQRTQEFGVRMALGASTGHVLSSVLRQGLSLGLLGIVIGLALAPAVTRLVSAFLHGVSPLDPVIFAAVAGLLAIVTVFACLIPAWRASRVDPMVALRYE